MWKRPSDSSGGRSDSRPYPRPYPQSACLGKDPVYEGGRAFLHSRSHMSVGIRRCRDGGMAEARRRGRPPRGRGTSRGRRRGPQRAAADWPAGGTETRLGFTTAPATGRRPRSLLGGQHEQRATGAVHVAVSGRTTTAKVDTTVAMVATLPRSVSSGEVNIQVSWNGDVVAVQPVTRSGSGELFGTTVGPSTLRAPSVTSSSISGAMPLRAAV